jgi:hypothetical protein
MSRWRAAVVSVIALAACQPAEELHGDPATIRAPFEVLFAGSVRSMDLAAPSISVARTPRDGRRIARRIGIGDAAGILRSWSDYDAQALIVMGVGNRFKAGSRLRVLEVRTPALLPQIEVTARVEPPADPGPLEPSVLWTIVSVSAGRVPADSAGQVPPELDCLLDMGAESTRTQCLPIPSGDEGG